MSWYNTSGALQNYVLFSKVRYTRNISKYNFYHLLDQKRTDELTARLDSILTGNGFRGERVTMGVNPSILSLAEKQFVERDFVYSQKPRALYLNEPCNLLVAIGGESLINISSIFSGLSIAEAKNMASGAEELIDRELPFAYLDTIGYLSPDPDKCGSCLSFSAALYLPSLRLSCDNLTLSKLVPRDMSLTPFFADGENSGDLYILSYIPHYLSNEDDDARHFTEYVKSVCEQEKVKLELIYKKSAADLQNEAMRALGALLYSSFISENELFSYLSSIRLCRCASGETPSALPPITALNYLTAEGLSASVISSAKEKCDSLTDCDKARASFVRAYIEHKKEVSNGK